MTRYLTVTCSAPKCHAEGRVQLYGLQARDLPAGWLVVGDSYRENPMEFCSLACVVTWGVAMQKAHESQRAWQSKPRPVKPIDKAPEGALL
jgi:hypothetical protein